MSTTGSLLTYRCRSNSWRSFVRSCETGIFKEYIVWISGACTPSLSVLPFLFPRPSSSALPAHTRLWIPHTARNHCRYEYMTLCRASSQLAATTELANSEIKKSEGSGKHTRLSRPGQVCRIGDSKRECGFHVGIEWKSAREGPLRQCSERAQSGWWP